MIGYQIATCNGSIVCQCVWSRMIVIGYDEAIIMGGQVIEPLLTTCRCVLHDRTSGNIWQHFRVVGLSRPFYIEMSHSVSEMKCRNAEHDFVRLKSHL